MRLFDKLFGRAAPHGANETTVADSTKAIIGLCEVVDADPNARALSEQTIKQAAGVLYLAGGLRLMQVVQQEVARRSKYGDYVNRLWAGLFGWPGPNR